jgi:hypothetical protein
MVDVAVVDRERILRAAKEYLPQQPITVTASTSPRTPGGPHEYFSESDYWWPDPKSPGGAYIRRDGETNPDNFDGHRQALRRLSLQVPALAAAWKISRDAKFRAQCAAKVDEHLRAWFIDEATHMEPNLQYAQGVHGVSTGRGVGVIDTIHLVEVARAADVLGAAGVLKRSTDEGSRAWFAKYLDWMTTSKNGLEERDAKNNHGSCWVMQAAEYASYTRNAQQMDWCRERFRTRLIPEQVAPDGSLPLELARTKPYSYSLFDMDILATICQILSSPRTGAGDNLWAFQTADGRGMKKVIGYMEPFIADKSKWPLKPDVQFFEVFPNRQPALLFGGLAYNEPAWVKLWARLQPDPKSEEAIRNFPIRQPVLWV